MKAVKPPRLARALLRLVPLGDRRAEVAADLREAFARRAEASDRVARRGYYRDVVSLFAQVPRQLASSLPKPSRWPVDALTDAVYAFRVFRRQTGAVLIAVMGLGVAIAVVTAVFSLLNAIMLRPYGMSDPDSVYRISRAYKNGMSTTWAFSDFQRIRRAATMTSVHAWRYDSAAFSETAEDQRPLSQGLAFVSDGYLEMLGGRAIHGRLLGSADNAGGATPAAVASYTFWKRRLHGDPSVVGRTVWLDGRPVIVVGVFERGFDGPTDRPPAFWLPFSAYESIYRAPEMFTPAAATGVVVFGRTAPGVTHARAQDEMQVIASEIARTTVAGPNGPVDGLNAQLDPADDRFAGPDAWQIRAAMGVVLTVIVLILILACANVANLQLASALTRRREFGMRLALGAGRGRVMRQVVCESLLLGAAGGVVGYVLTIWTLPGLAALAQAPDSFDIAPDWRVYGFLTLASMVAGLCAGLTPARLAARTDVVASANGRDGRHGHLPSRLRSFLIGAQATASILLLVLASLMVRAMVRTSRLDFGFDPAGVIAVSPTLPSDGRAADRARRYFEAAADRARAVPGVQAVALAVYAPFSGMATTSQGQLDGQPLVVHFNYTSANYFDVLGMRILRGRTFSAAEIAGEEKVAVITDGLARRLFGAADPIGQLLSTFDGSVRNTRVIGVIADANTSRIDGDANMIYEPLTLPRLAEARLVLRASGPPPSTLLRPLEQSMREIDPDVRSAATLITDGIEGQLQGPRALAAVSASIGAIALVLSVIGLYGVTALAVGQRTREIGVRMAIGATVADVRRLMMRESLRPVLIGLAIGLAIALLAGQVLAGILFGVSPRDPMAIAAATAILCIAAATAVVIPARRTSRIDPARTLRAD